MRITSLNIYGKKPQYKPIFIGQQSKKSTYLFNILSIIPASLIAPNISHASEVVLLCKGDLSVSGSKPDPMNFSAVLDTETGKILEIPNIIAPGCQDIPNLNIKIIREIKITKATYSNFCRAGAMYTSLVTIGRYNLSMEVRTVFSATPANDVETYWGRYKCELGRKQEF